MGVFKDVFKENGKIILLALGLLVAASVGLFFLNKTNFLPNMNMTNVSTHEEGSDSSVVLPDYNAVLKTSMGDIEVKLFSKETPVAVENFVKLSKQGFYNGLTFHRVIKDFVIQGGDPKGNGTGGPGYQFDNEITDRKFEKYSLAMANAGRPGTNGSQFFFTVGSIDRATLEHLDGDYTIFGIVTSGEDVVDRISKVATDANDKPANAVIIESITIVE